MLIAGLAGGVWGLGLARLLSESTPGTPTFGLGASLLVALAAALATASSCLWLSHRMGRVEDRPLAAAFLPLILALLYVFWPRFEPQVGRVVLTGSLALTALLILRHAWRTSAMGSRLFYRNLVALFLAVAVFVIYLRTLGPTVGQADTFEFQVVAPTLGVAHPTGYPLYILSGKLFSLLPLGSVAWRVNLTSTVFGTLAIVFLYQLIARLTHRPLVALLASVALAASRVFWSQAVVAEVYALHNMFVALVLLILLEGFNNRRWFSGAQSDAQSESVIGNMEGNRKRERNRVYALAFLFGLGFANHLTIALVLPAVALTLLLLRPRLRWKEWLLAAVLLLIGLSLYLFVYFRWPMLHDGVWLSLNEFWRYVTGQQFSGALRFDAWRSDPTRYEIVGRLLREPFGWPGLALGAIGLIWLTIKRPRIALVTFITALVFSWYGLSYYVPDVSVFLLPAHLILAVWLGVGVAAIFSASSSFFGRLSRSRCFHGDARGMFLTGVRPWGGAALVALFALLPLWLLWKNLPVVDQSGERDSYAWGDMILDLPLARDAAILADSIRIAPLYYLQRIEGRRLDLDLLVLADEDTYREELESRLAVGQAVYLSRYLPGLEGRFHLRSLGPLTEVGTASLIEPPAFDRALGVRFGHPVGDGGRIELLGISGPAPGPEGGTGLTLYWRSDGQVDEVYHVRIRLVDDVGRVWWQDVGRHAVNNYYPTPAWRPQEVVADYHEIPPLMGDPVAAPDGLAVEVGLYRPFSDEGLTTDSGELWYSALRLAPSDLAKSPDPNRPLHIRFSELPESGLEVGDGLALVGVDLPDTVAIDSLAELGLYFAPEYASKISTGSRESLGDFSLTWTDRQGKLSEAPIVENWGGSFLVVQTPDSPGDYDLRLGLRDGHGRFVRVQCGWLAQPTQDCVLGKVRVTEVPETSVLNFRKMLLMDVSFDSSELANGSMAPMSPGQNLSLTLNWQALQSMDEDYTISVQLVGPDGRLYGQTDSWPVQGTFPTSQWSPGQRIADPYQVVLSPDAPPGDYRVGVAVYLLATQTRLPLVDESGQVIADIAWVGELRVVLK